LDLSSRSELGECVVSINLFVGLTDLSSISVHRMSAPEPYSRYGD